MIINDNLFSPAKSMHGEGLFTIPSNGISVLQNACAFLLPEVAQQFLH
jgi:hypothetical protein